MMPNPDLGLKVNPTGLSSYDYQELLERGCCSQCLKPLDWQLVNLGTGDDRFCQATCCDLRYSMIPHQVKVISELAYTATEDEDTEMCDDDFIRELEKMGNGYEDEN